jgi:butyryl-CoA dehydrogenase
MDFQLSDEQSQLQTVARDFAEQEVAPVAREADERGVFPTHLIPRMAELGFFTPPGLDPRDFGLETPKTGSRSHLDYVLICEELGKADSSVRGFLTVHVGLVAGCIQEWGTAEQKARYLPPLV